MLIRRNMSSNLTYQDLKEYPCFKQLAKVNDVMILKQLLPLIVTKVSLESVKQNFNPSKFLYISEESSDLVDSKSTLDQIINRNGMNQVSNKSFQGNKVKLFMIEIKIYNILRNVFHKKIECMEHLKHFQRLNFLYRSNLNDIPFGGYVYRKDDQTLNIYYIVKGEIRISKSIDEKEINICTIYEGTFFGIYQFERNKIKRVLNAQSCSNNTMVLSFSLDMLSELFGKEENLFLNKLLGLQSEISKIKDEKNKKLSITNTKNKKPSFIKAHEFERRLTKFSMQRDVNRNHPVFGQYIQNNSLLFKINDIKYSVPRLEQDKFTITSNFHKNQTTLKYHKRLNQHRTRTLCSNLPKMKENTETNNAKLSSISSSQILSLRLKNRFKHSKTNFYSKGFDSTLTSFTSRIQSE